MPIFDFDLLYSSIHKYQLLFGKKWSRNLQKSKFKKLLEDAYSAAFVPGQSEYAGGQLQPQKYDSRMLPSLYLAQTGLVMEAHVMALKSVAQEMIDARITVDEIYKRMAETHSTLVSQMSLLVKDLRDRQFEMTIEAKNSIKTMKEVREFFLDKEHKVEMERLKEFIKICRDLKVLIDDGTLSAVASAIAKLGGD